MMRKIGIMGGTFDPIHIGHLIAAERSKETFDLDEVWFIPNAGPPLKENAPGASPEERLKMAQLAAEGDSRFKVLDIELRRGGVSYSIDTVEQLRSADSEAELYLIIGTDRIRDLPRWHRIDELARLVWFVGVDRPPDEDGMMPSGSEAQDALPLHLKERILHAPMPQLEVSSTLIRSRLEKGLSVRHYVPDPVCRYLMEKGLYRAHG